MVAETAQSAKVARCVIRGDLWLPWGPMSSLRRRREAQTKVDIFDAAIGLFLERGFDATTMAEVAEAADVSRRTVYRYFATKEDLAFLPSDRWMERLDELIASREPGESTRDLCRRAVLGVAEFIAADRDSILRALEMLAATPSLLDRHSRSNAEWRDAYVALITADLPPDDPQSLVAATTLGGAIVGGTDAATVVWALHPDLDLVDITAGVLRDVEPLWPDACR